MAEPNRSNKLLKPRRYAVTKRGLKKSSHRSLCTAFCAFWCLSLELDAASREAGVADLVVAQVVDEALDVGGE